MFLIIYKAIFLALSFYSFYKWIHYDKEMRVYYRDFKNCSSMDEQFKELKLHYYNLYHLNKGKKLKWTFICLLSFFGLFIYFVAWLSII